MHGRLCGNIAGGIVAGRGQYHGADRQEPDREYRQGNHRFDQQISAFPIWYDLFQRVAFHCLLPLRGSIYPHISCAGGLLKNIHEIFGLTVLHPDPAHGTDDQHFELSPRVCQRYRSGSTGGAAGIKVRLGKSAGFDRYSGGELSLANDGFCAIQKAVVFHPSGSGAVVDKYLISVAEKFDNDPAALPGRTGFGCLQIAFEVVSGTAQIHIASPAENTGRCRNRKDAHNGNDHHQLCERQAISVKSDLHWLFSAERKFFPDSK
jgi:hypothetical protein